MKRSLINFTRGSQLLGHFGFMFAAGLKGPALAALALVLGLGWWQMKTALSDHQTYLLWMHLYASAYTFMEFDPDRLVHLNTATDGPVAFPINVVTAYPPMREAADAFTAAVRSTLVLSGALLAPLLGLFWWIAERFGEHSKQKKHLRGAALVTLAELEHQLARHNAGERAAAYGAVLGWRWRLADSRTLDRAGFYTPAHLAGVAWPWRREQSHTMLVGTTGTGKTVALTALLAEIRQRGERAVVFDLTGAFIEAFYRADSDIILNPLDARCPAWSVFNDCTTRAEFHAAAESLVPHDGGGSEQFWVLAARTLFVETCLKLAGEGRGSNQALATELMNADLTALHELLEDTMAGPITTPTAARMAESVRAVFNVNAKAMQLLPTDGAPFSIRQWVGKETRRGSLLFLSARYADMSVLSQMLTLWLDMAITTLMTGKRRRDLGLWFLIDELGALHRLPSLEKGLQTARNFGGAIVTGVHAYAKLKDVYGENMAMTLSSLTRTKLILATADRETATWCSDIIGHREVREMEEGYSYGYNNARDAVSLTPRRQIVPLVLPDELMGLRSLAGYIRFPDGFPAAPVTLAPRKWPRVAEGFIARAMIPPGPAADRADSGGTRGQRVTGRHGGDSTDRSDARGTGDLARPTAGSPKARPPAKSRRRSTARVRQAERGAVKPGAAPPRSTQAAAARRQPAIPHPVPAGWQEAAPAPDEHQAGSRAPVAGSGGVRGPGLSDPQTPKWTDSDGTSPGQRACEQQQRGLLGGAVLPGSLREMGDIEPDI